MAKRLFENCLVFRTPSTCHSLIYKLRENVMIGQPEIQSVAITYTNMPLHAHAHTNTHVYTCSKTYCLMCPVCFITWDDTFKYYCSMESTSTRLNSSDINRCLCVRVCLCVDHELWPKEPTVPLNYKRYAHPHTTTQATYKLCKTHWSLTEVIWFKPHSWWVFPACTERIDRVHFNGTNRCLSMYLSTSRWLTITL